MKILCFDTETTGIENSADKTKPAARAVQLAARMIDIEEVPKFPFDIKTHHDLKCIIDTGVTVPPKPAEIHGITTELTEHAGIPHEDALFFFAALIRQADAFLGHNLTYDINIMRHAYHLEGFEGEPFADKPVFDTMRLSTDILKLPKPKKWMSKPGDRYKWPNLGESYKFYKLWELGKYVENPDVDFDVCPEEVARYCTHSHELDKLVVDTPRAIEEIDEELKNAHDAMFDVNLSIEVFFSYLRYSKTNIFGG